jgi:GT2 family glycosyltransferase
VDIIIPAYKNLDISSRAFFGCLMNRPSPEDRILFVDNGSEGALDPLKPIVEAHGQEWIHIEDNVGPYGAVNAGLAQAGDGVIAVVCNDVVPLPFSLARMAGALTDKTPVIGACEIQTSPYNTDALIAEAEDRGFYRDEGLRPGVFFSCFVTTRNIYQLVGEFDTRFRLTFGDTDWEQRLADHSAPYMIHSGAPVYHGSSVTRKRLGLEEDMRVDIGDHIAFREKWHHRTDVLARHPMEDINFKMSFVEREWSYRGEK